MRHVRIDDQILMIPYFGMKDLNRKNHIELICKFLKIWRRPQNISQEIVYNRTGIDVSNYENGKCLPGIITILSLCDFYGLTFDNLLKSAEAVDRGSISIGDFFEIAERIRQLAVGSH
jgi:transcriptional regulator with XRE-family HTH domain